MLGAAVAVLVASGLAAGVRTTYGGHAAVDEPQYLLTALSLWEDRSLDISDELEQERWRAFHDTDLPVQTEVLAGGRQVSPHDPLLPLVLAAPMGLGGWVAAKLALALLAAAIAALTVWVAVRRFAVTPWLAGVGTAAVFASPPLAVYGSQVYPELPAAGTVVLAVAAATGPLGRRAMLTVAAATVALPWLSVKYAPVAAVVAALVLWRLVRSHRHRAAVALSGGLALAGLAYLGLHRLWWGGWTVYASGDHFTDTGELSVMGVSPDLAGRTLRLVALFVDRGYGIAAWAPVWLLGVVAVATLLRRRPAGTSLLLLPLAVGWAVATWAAFTMHGFWWPGRQLVVVLPLLLIAVLWWADRVAGPLGRAVAAVLAGLGVLATSTLLLDGLAGQLTWVTGFQDVDNPVYRWSRVLLPDYRNPGAAMWSLHALWIAVLCVLAVAGWRQARTPRTPQSSAPEPPVPTPELTSV
jgi:hypothetical protein